MLRPTVAADERFVTNSLTEGIARHRHILWIVLLILYAVAFNGQWRIGQDSAIYRGLASNIAAGKGYQFGEWASHQAYPGLPYLLAGIQKICRLPIDDLRGRGAFAFVDLRLDTVLSVLMILAMSALTLVLTYQLIAMHYPPWIAVTVTFLMGLNSWYLQLSNELLTDIPFLLGIVTALYGWELLKRAEKVGRGLGAAIVIVVGLALAASMRPMFWVVGSAWIIVCVWALIRGKRRVLHAITLVLLIAVWMTLVRIDPRNQGSMNPFAGGYEREFLELLPAVHITFADRLYESLRHQIPAAFFGEQMSPFSIVASLLVLASCVLLFRRHPLWGLMVFIAFGVTLVTSSEARYYIMVLPLMLLGWLLMLLLISRRLAPQHATIVLAVGIALVALNNFSANIGFIREQRSRPFVEGYKRGRYVTLLRMCDVVRERVKDDERAIGPLASAMSYITGKTVLSQREVLPRGNVTAYPCALHEANLKYAVFPSSIYRVKDPMIARLMERNIIQVTKKLEWVDEKWYLARIRIRVPDVPDWRDLPKGWSPP